ncbi:MAG: hypothetical protein DSM106950_38660 [Stigonema ocellatum SAG 48.90 = DSM 106950]|nr:hypothetical protein [Stigonema ocellatum SAG 48.90 = DSM 106950]
MKKLELPVWFPYLSSWLSALTLSVLISGFVVIVRRNNGLLFYLARLSDRPELLTVLLILLLLLFIPAIAFFHHFFLSHFIPAIPGEKINKPQGFVPGLISWWESLYSWLVLVLSTLIATVFCTPILALFKLNYKTIISTYSQSHQNIQIIFALVWLINAVILYQIEYLVKLRLIFGNSVSSQPESTTSDTSIDVKTDSIQSEIDLTQTATTDKPAKPATRKQTVFDLIAKQRNLPKKIFTVMLIPLVALWIYLFAKLPEVRQTVSTNLTLENPSPVTSELVSTKSKSTDSIPKNAPVTTKLKPSDSLPKHVTFEQALKKGKRAAKLTKTAQSQDDWKIVESRWREAIQFMEAVPTSSPHYALAQEKIIQYHNHLDFARKNALGG